MDTNRPIMPPDGDPRTYRVALVEADGNDALRLTASEGGNRGEAGDAFGAEALDHLSLATQPPTRLKGQGYAPVTFHSIDVDEEEAEARIRLTTVPIERDRLLEPFLKTGGESLTPEEKELLDGFGSETGSLNLGDLRRYLLDVERSGPPEP